MTANEGRQTLVIVNPVAHNLPSPRRLDEAAAWLRAAGWQAEWRETAARGDATEMARAAAERRLPLVIACGGDGTLNETVNGLAGSETALAQIRAGTVNLWGREIGIPRKPADAVRTAIEGERRRVDLGRAGDRYFMLLVSYGLDGAITRRASMRLKDHFGATAYALAAIREWLRYRSSRLRLRLDGDELEAEVLQLTAGNTRNYAGLTQITTEAVADDGLLDICVYQGKGTLDILLHVTRTLLRRHRKSKKVVYRQVRRLEISSNEPLPVQIDGEELDGSPSMVEVVPDALWVVVPNGLRSPLFRD